MYWKFINPIAALFFILTTIGCQEYQDIPDKQAIDMFESKKEKFQTIVEMLDQDYSACKGNSESDAECFIFINVIGHGSAPISVGGVYQVGDTTQPKSMTIKRLEEFITIAGAIGLKDANISRTRYGQVAIMYSLISPTIGSSSSRRQFVHKPEYPLPLYDNLIIPLPESDLLVGFAHYGYRKINDNWYLYLHHDD